MALRGRVWFYLFFVHLLWQVTWCGADDERTLSIDNSECNCPWPPEYCTKCPQNGRCEEKICKCKYGFRADSTKTICLFSLLWLDHISVIPSSAVRSNNAIPMCLYETDRLLTFQSGAGTFLINTRSLIQSLFKSFPSGDLHYTIAGKSFNTVPFLIFVCFWFCSRLNALDLAHRISSFNLEFFSDLGVLLTYRRFTLV